MGSTQGTLETIDKVTETAAAELPYFTGLLGLIPGVGPYLPAIIAAIQAVHTIVHQMPGTSVQQAVAQVVDHNTEGQPNSPIRGSTGGASGA